MLVRGGFPPVEASEGDEMFRACQMHRNLPRSGRLFRARVRALKGCSVSSRFHPFRD